MANETKLYPADFPLELSKTTRVETGLKFVVVNNSLRLVDLAFHARLDTYNLWCVSPPGGPAVAGGEGRLNLFAYSTVITLTQ